MPEITLVSCRPIPSCRQMPAGDRAFLSNLSPVAIQSCVSLTRAVVGKGCHSVLVILTGTNDLLLLPPNLTRRTTRVHDVDVTVFFHRDEHLQFS
jgi:hypothetical protein